MIYSLRFGSTKNSSPKTSRASTNTSKTKPEARHTRKAVRALFRRTATKQLHAKELYKMGCRQPHSTTTHQILGTNR
ncbi:unnamed protein product, partial [Brassica rapa subsp. trilocularis]